MTTSVDALLDDLSMLDSQQAVIVQAVRDLVKSLYPRVTEEVKYGGILFSVGVHFCGVFAYREHVSVEFSQGAQIPDAIGHLEGRGKLRRHTKLRTVGDIGAKSLRQYLPLALDAAA